MAEARQVLLADNITADDRRRAWHRFNMAFMMKIRVLKESAAKFDDMKLLKNRTFAWIKTHTE